MSLLLATAALHRWAASPTPPPWGNGSCPWPTAGPVAPQLVQRPYQPRWDQRAAAQICLHHEQDRGEPDWRNASAGGGAEGEGGRFSGGWEVLQGPAAALGTRQRLKGLSCLKGNFHEQFFGGWAGAPFPPHSLAPLAWRLSYRASSMARAPLARNCSAKRCPSCMASAAAPRISWRHWQRPSGVLTSPCRCNTSA